MKELKELKGAKILSKNEQKAITGGLACIGGTGCPTGSYCCHPEPDIYICRKNGSACY